MSEEYKSPVFKKWLDVLQQESWQLELIISGFALYALFTAFGPVELETKRAIVFENSIEIYFMSFTLASVFILILNLTIHVTLRGLWIGAIGLRYVSGDIDYDELRYTLKFRNHLEKKVGSFDKFIADLENYCSIIFATTFLMVFYILALFLIFGIIYLTSLLINSIENEILRNITSFILLFVILGGSALTFIDFITQGWLKRKKWLAIVYFPFYRLFSILSLSFIYRPIVYNLLDNKFGRRLARILIPLYLVILMISSINKVNSNYIPINFEDNFFKLEQSEYISSPVNYDDELGDDKFVWIVSIPSKVITTRYMPVFIPFSERIEDNIYASCPEVIPENDRRGITSSMVKLESLTVSEKRELTRAYLDCFSSMYTIRIDGKFIPGEFVISQNRQEQSGFQTVLPLDSLQTGRHILEFAKVEEADSSVLARVAFWFYPD